MDRSTGTTYEHEAYKFADDLYHELLVKVHRGEVVQGKRITTAIDAYIERFQSEADRQSVHYRILLLRRIRPLLAKQVFENFDTAAISTLIDGLRKGTKTGTMSPNTVQRIQNDVRNFLTWCVEQGYLNQLPTFPRVNSEKSRRPHFNDREWRKLTRNLREFVKVTNRKTLRERIMLVNYVLILANTGIRTGEARNLKWRDVREVGSGEGKPKNVVLTVKGKTGEREVVSRTPDIKQYFQRLLRLRLAEIDESQPDPDGLIFCHKDGSAVGSFKKSFQTLLKKCGLERDSFGRPRTIYSLRHTYATFRLHEGVNHLVLARNMGTSVQMLEQYYGHTSNLAMSEELTKGKKPSDKAEKSLPNRKSRDATFGWLDDDISTRKVERKTQESDASYVDLVTD